MDFPRQASPPLGTLSRPTPTVWVLELKNGKDNRFTKEFLTEVISPALDVVEREWRTDRRKALAGDLDTKGAGALIIVGRLDQDKFFSNGFNFEEVINTPGLGFIYTNFVPILTRLVTFPIPTIAALNGHTFAAGFMLSMACDYRVMTSGKAWACMNELSFGSPFPHSFAALFQEKARNPALLRKIVLEGHKFTPEEMLDAGLVDHLAEGGSAGVLRKAIEVGQKIGPNAGTGVWGLIKKELYTKTLTMMAEDTRQVMPFEEEDVARIREKAKL